MDTKTLPVNAPTSAHARMAVADLLLRENRPFVVTGATERDGETLPFAKVALEAKGHGKYANDPLRTYDVTIERVLIEL